MYYCDFKYYKDDAFILSSDILSKNKIQKGLLDIKILSCEGTPIDNANIRVFSQNENNDYTIHIEAQGYNPVQVKNVKIYPGYLSKLNVNLIPLQSESTTQTHDQLQTFKNMQIDPAILKLPQDEIRDITMSLGMVTPVGSPSYIYAERFAQEVNNLSNGKIKIDINTDAKLGTDRDMLKNILNYDNIDLIVQTTPPQVDFMPKLSVFDMPMVYTNESDLRNAINNTEFYEKISDVYEDGGYKLLGYSDPLFRQLTTNKEIQNIDDFNEISIRTIQNKNHEEFWRLLGAKLVPLPVSEIYSSLQLGYIDSADNPYENIIALKLYEQQKYIVRTSHLPHLVNLITSKEYYDSLTTAEKAIIDEAAANATAYVREGADENLAQRRKSLVDKGMTIIELPEETKQEMRLRAVPVYERIRNLVNDDELINLYMGNVSV